MKTGILRRQRESAEGKPLGRVERTWNWNEETGRSREGQRRLDASIAPPLVIANEYPVGRPRGVVRPGQESQGERYVAPSFPTSLTVPSKVKRNKGK